MIKVHRRLNIDLVLSGVRLIRAPPRCTCPSSSQLIFCVELESWCLKELVSNIASDR
jgi:hypothetical protein